MRRALVSILVPFLAAAATPPSFDPVVFEEVAAARGLRFVTNSGRTPRKHQPETMVAGVAVLDYDGDGWLDVYLVNGTALPALEKTGPEYWNRLFRNDGKGSFTDVTEAAGVRGRGYDLGAVSAE